MTPRNLVIRATRNDDWEGIAALVALPKFRWGTLRLPYPAPDDVRKWIESRSRGDVSIVAVLDGRIVGEAGLHRFAGRRAHTAEIGMGVHDDFQRQGIGSALLAALIDAADNWLDLRRLQLSVFTDNAPAIALYDKAGFVIEGTFRMYAFRGGAYADAYGMARVREP